MKGYLFREKWSKRVRRKICANRQWVSFLRNLPLDTSMQSVDYHPDRSIVHTRSRSTISPERGSIYPLSTLNVDWFQDSRDLWMAKFPIPSQYCDIIESFIHFFSILCQLRSEINRELSLSETESFSSVYPRYLTFRSILLLYLLLPTSM